MIPDVTAWLDAGADLHAKLADERAQLVARIADIDDAIGKLGQQGHAPLDPPIARQVVAALAAAGRAMTSREVRAALPRAPGLTVGGALHSLAKRGEIRSYTLDGRRFYAAAQKEA